MEKLTVIKVGGKIVEEEATLYKLLDDFAAIEGYKVLVHGGGRSATKIAARLDIESKMINGRRITDAETLKVVTMVYGGLVNKNIVAGLQARGVNALGLTGADMDVIRSVKRPVKEVDYGFVGDVRQPVPLSIVRQRSPYGNHTFMTAVCQEGGIQLPHNAFNPIIHLPYGTFYGTNHIHLTPR